MDCNILAHDRGHGKLTGRSFTTCGPFSIRAKWRSRGMATAVRPISRSLRLQRRHHPSTHPKSSPTGVREPTHENLGSASALMGEVTLHQCLLWGNLNNAVIDQWVYTRFSCGLTSNLEVQLFLDWKVDFIYWLRIL